MPTFILPPWTCPGAFSICMNCSSFLRLEAGMRLSVATEEDLADAPVSFLEVLAQVQEIVKLMHEQRGQSIKTDAKRMN